MQRRRATSPARINANRRIACRHGFSIPVLAEPTLAPEVRATARAIERSLAGRELDPPGHALACRVAEAMIDLRRVRIAKLPLTAAVHADPANGRRALTELARLDRYERRALSRRNTAIYALAAAVRDCRVGKIALDHSSAWATARRSDFAHAATGGAVAHPTGCRTWQNLSENPNEIRHPPHPSTTGAPSCVALR